MAIFDARRPGAVSHGGTFNGNPVAAAAGLATLRELTPDAYARLDASASASGPRSRADRGDGLDARVTVGSLFQVFARRRATAFATGVGRRSDAVPRPPARGFLFAPRGMGAIPTVATEQRRRRPRGRDRAGPGGDGGGHAGGRRLTQDGRPGLRG